MSWINRVVDADELLDDPAEPPLLGKTRQACVGCNEMLQFADERLTLAGSHSRAGTSLPGKCGGLGSRLRRGELLRTARDNQVD